MHFPRYIIVFMAAACGVANARCPRNRYRVCYNAPSAMYYASGPAPCNQNYDEICCRTSSAVAYKAFRTTSISPGDFIHDNC
ncbi:hypothetical protein H4Q26_012186 [Puccinia striiformis f. sp. tritici PST-130]|nr:hypothetical protein H4Q26_012186 [Puccinia striiformis f. sp. tritici PST-130]